jgi:hypothetical protein
LDLDTLRHDHPGCYGYRRDTSNNIDSVAREGVVFDNYYCPNAPYLPSRASLIFGKFGIINGVVGHGGTTADMRLEGAVREFGQRVSHWSLFNIFRRAGFKTASISTFAERHSAWWFNAGFNECYNVGGGGMESGEQVVPIAEKWLNENSKNDNWLLHLNFWDAHTPYRAPKDFGKQFNSPIRIDNKHIIMEAIKKSEDGKETAVRLYNNSNSAIKTQIKLNPVFTSAALANLAENKIREMHPNSLKLTFKPFEIHTLLIGDKKNELL